MQMKALIVDDDPVNRKLLKAILKKEGYIPFEVENGEAAIVAFNRERPDIILMDIMMPGISGLETTRMLKDDPATADIPIIVTSGYGMRGDEEELRASGCDGFIAKPCLPPDLVARVLEFLRPKSRAAKTAPKVRARS